MIPSDRSTREQLARRRAELVDRSDSDRAELARYARRLEGPLQLAGSALGLANTLRRSPLTITAMAALLIRTPWRKMARLPKLAWRAWRVFNFVRAWAR